MSTTNTTRDMDNKRKRLTQACELCRRKKIKCDGNKPTCGNCTRLNNECTYSTNSKKRGPRQGYIEMLEQRLAKMEKILLSPTTKKISTPGVEDTDEDIEEQSALPPPASVPGKPRTIEEATTFIPNVTGGSSVSHQKQQQRSTEESSHDCASPTSYSSISTTNFPSPPGHHHHHPIHHHHLLRQENNELMQPPPPSMELTEHIVELYFKYLYITLPIFDEHSLRQDIKERKCPDFLLYSLFGACARFSDRAGIKSNPPWRAGEKYAEKARSMLIKVMDEPNIPNLQGLTLLTLHEYGCGRESRSWMYGGMATRMAIELGLHEDIEDENETNNSFDVLITQETRRRLFWTIFVIDKFSSAATGKPTSLQDNFCTIFLPAKVDRNNFEKYYTETLDNSRYLLLNVNGLRESQLLGTGSAQVVNHNSSLSSSSSSSSSSPSQQLGRRSPLNCFAYLIRAANILGKITNYVNKKGKFGKNQNDLAPFHPDSEFSQLDQMIEDLYEQLPMHLKNTPTNFELYKESIYLSDNRHFIQLHVLYNTLIVLLHRPTLVLADTMDNGVIHPEFREFIQKSVDKCMAAVDNVTVLLNEIGTQIELMPPFLTYLAYTVATVVVSTSFSPRKEESQKARQALGVYFRLLLAARNYWAMADKLYFMIRDLYAIHSNVLVSKKDNQQVFRNTPATTATTTVTPHVAQQVSPVVAQQQQQFHHQQQQQQQYHQQQVQLQHLNQTTMLNSSSWDTNFYNVALLGRDNGNTTTTTTTSELDFNFIRSRENSSSVETNVFQLPEGL